MQIVRSGSYCNRTVGNKAPDFIGIALSGDVIQLSQLTLRGDVLLYFFTSNDRRHRELESLRPFYDQHSRDSLLIIGIDLQEQLDVTERYVKENDIQWTVVKDNWCDNLYHLGGWSIGSLFPVAELPLFIMIAKGGIVQSCDNQMTED